jgi:hypothetical protein
MVKKRSGATQLSTSCLALLELSGQDPKVMQKWFLALFILWGLYSLGPLFSGTFILWDNFLLKLK